MLTSTATTKAQLQYILMIVTALRQMNGSAKAAAVKGWIAQELTAAGQDMPDTVLGSGGSKFANDIQWARMYLVNAEFLQPMATSGRGTWSLTPKGWETPLTPSFGQQIYDLSLKKGKVAKSDSEKAPESDNCQGELAAAVSWTSDLVKLLPNLPPEGFERLCARILSKSGPIFRDGISMGPSYTPLQTLPQPPGSPHQMGD